ncbi:hypothetical protein Tco_0305470 [Tanacetum coccineum]
MIIRCSIENQEYCFGVVLHYKNHFTGSINVTKVHLYDIAAQRITVMSFNFRETPIKAVTEDLDGNTIYIGIGSGDLASIDIRTLIKLNQILMAYFKRSETLHIKLARKLYETKTSLTTALKELAKERRSRVPLEDLCDELAWEIKNYEQEMYSLKHINPEKCNGSNHKAARDGLILHILESRLDERMQNKQVVFNKAADAKLLQLLERQQLLTYQLLTISAHHGISQFE